MTEHWRTGTEVIIIFFVFNSSTSFLLLCVRQRTFPKTHGEVRLLFPPFQPDGGKADGGAACGVSWQTSVLRSICCVAGCLSRNIQAQCPSLRRPVSHRWGAHRLASTTRTAACFYFYFLSLCFQSHPLLRSTTLPSVFVPQRQNLANRQRWEAQQARPPLPITPPCDGQADRRVPAQSHRFDFLSWIKVGTFLERCKQRRSCAFFVQTKNCSLS